MTATVNTVKEKKKVLQLKNINNVGFDEHTNTLFLKSHALKFMDIVKLNTAQKMFKVRNIQK